MGWGKNSIERGDEWADDIASKHRYYEERQRQERLEESLHFDIERMERQFNEEQRKLKYIKKILKKLTSFVYTRKSINHIYTNLDIRKDWIERIQVASTLDNLEELNTVFSNIIREMMEHYPTISTVGVRVTRKRWIICHPISQWYRKLALALIEKEQNACSHRAEELIKQFRTSCGETGKRI